MQESLIFSMSTCTTSSSGRRMLNPSWTLRCVSHRMNPTIYGVHADECGPFLIVLSRANLDQVRPVLPSMPYYTYCFRRYSTGWETSYISAPKVPCCCNTMKARRDGSRRISSAVYFANDDKSSASCISGKGFGFCDNLAYIRASPITGSK